MDQDDVEEIWKALVSAKINSLVFQTRPPPRQLNPDHDTLLESEVNRKLDEVFRSRRNPEFIYLRPQQWLDWYGQLFSAVIGIAVLGAGFTFSLIFSSLEQPFKHNEAYVRKCIAASWMLFVLSLGWASFLALLVSVNRTRTLKEIASKENWYNLNECPLLFFLTPSILISQLLPVGAFIASADAMRQYHNRLGIATLTMVSLVGVAATGAWAGQNM
ncbi:hypothetical protein PMZ80_007881 [Knufia obscura]|nr:hypothetical protein PMZ80_007881 [Knufia obscura]